MAALCAWLTVRRYLDVLKCCHWPAGGQMSAGTIGPALTQGHYQLLDVYTTVRNVAILVVISVVIYGSQQF